MDFQRQVMSGFMNVIANDIYRFVFSKEFEESMRTIFGLHFL